MDPSAGTIGGDPRWRSAYGKRLAVELFGLRALKQKETGLETSLRGSF
jgi:hypothetical protein